MKLGWTGRRESDGTNEPSESLRGRLQWLMPLEGATRATLIAALT
jgi:hypothetical protein